MVSRFERFVSLSSAISRNLHKIASKEMEKYGLKGLYAIYLVTMYRYPEGITAAHLCDLCEKNKAAVSRVLAELETIGLIHREESNYRTKLFLTSEGKKAARYVSERAKLAVDMAGKGLTEEHRTIFYNSLDLIASNLQIIGKEGLPANEPD